jgi:hypothetical protein
MSPPANPFNTVLSLKTTLVVSRTVQAGTLVAVADAVAVAFASACAPALFCSVGGLCAFQRKRRRAQTKKRAGPKTCPPSSVCNVENRGGGASVR